MTYNLQQTEQFVNQARATVREARKLQVVARAPKSSQCTINSLGSCLVQSNNCQVASFIFFNALSKIKFVGLAHENPSVGSCRFQLEIGDMQKLEKCCAETQNVKLEFKFQFCKFNVSSYLLKKECLKFAICICFSLIGESNRNPVAQATCRNSSLLKPKQWRYLS